MTDDLQPCPFCGGRLTQDSRMMMASCGTADCYMRGLAVDLDDAESVERWNRRTPDLIPRADAEMAVAEAIRQCDLIRRMDAVQACQIGPSDEWSRSTKSGYEQAATDCARNILRIEPAAPVEDLAEVQRLRARVTSLSEQVDTIATHRDAALAERDSFRAVLEGACYGDIGGIAKNTPETSRMLGEVVAKRSLDFRARAEKAEAERVAALARVEKLREAETSAESFDRADWFWRTMDPDDCGDSPEEAISRAMVGQFCVCEIASSFAGPTRYGFIAPVSDPESDDEEFIHFATQDEAINEAKRRAALDEDARHG